VERDVSWSGEVAMERKQIDAKRLGTVAHYIGVVGEYFIVIFLQDVGFRIDGLRVVSHRLVLLASVYGGPRDHWFF
jgi:hypothetical protein